MNKNKIYLVLSILIIVLIIMFVNNYTVKRDTETINPIPKPVVSLISDGIISFSVPKDFALAMSVNQILVKAYIPPCNDGFEYCVYYDGPDYKGTNLESAGVSILKRNDLKDVDVCLNTAPQGFDIKSTVLSTTSSRFGPLGDAAAGHYTSGNMYRVYKNNNTCYEVETRIGLTRYENYPEGDIKKFTDEDFQILNDRLIEFVESI